MYFLVQIDFETKCCAKMKKRTYAIRKIIFERLRITHITFYINDFMEAANIVRKSLTYPIIELFNMAMHR